MPYAILCGKDIIAHERNPDGAIYRAKQEAQQRAWNSPSITVVTVRTGKSPYEIKSGTMDVVRNDMELW
ncbi:hypothetical protein ACQ4M5_28350 [Leptolyngbya sp. AN10]